MPDRNDPRFRWAVEASPSGMLIVDRTGTIVFSNSRANDMFGYYRDTLQDRQIEDLIPPRHRGLHTKVRTRFTGAPRTRPMGSGRDLVGLRQDGSEFPVEVGLNPIQEGDHLLVLASIIDITERKKEEEAAQRSREDLERLLYVISHDLRQPLGVIEGLAAHLLEDLGQKLDDPDKDHLEHIVRATEHLDALLNDLLLLSQARATGDRRVPIEGGELVQEVLAMLSREIEESGATVDLSRTFPLLYVEPTWALHALENLVSNALRYHRKGQAPEVVIKGYDKEEEGQVLAGFVVSDRGPGIPEDHLSKIFELFRRGPGPTTKGTGAGLTIAQEVAMRSGGKCVARNRPGGGAEFTLAFGNQSLRS